MSTWQRFQTDWRHCHAWRDDRIITAKEKAFGLQQQVSAPTYESLEDRIDEQDALEREMWERP